MINIEDRLAALESKNNRLRKMNYSLIGLVAVSLVLGAAPQKADRVKEDGQPVKEIKASRLVIVDDEGAERIVMEVGKKRLNNEKTDKRTDVFATLSFTDAEGVERASLDASDGGLARLKLLSNEGKRRVEIFSAGDSIANMFLYDSDGKEVVKKFR